MAGSQWKSEEALKTAREGAGARLSTRLLRYYDSEERRESARSENEVYIQRYQNNDKEHYKCPNKAKSCLQRLTVRFSDLC